MAKPPIGYNDPTIGGLVGWWTMNEGIGTVTTADLSGNGNTGYLTNSPAWTNGVVRSGLKFGTNYNSGQLISVLDSPSFKLQNGGCISFWCFPVIKSWSGYGMSLISKRSYLLSEWTIYLASNTGYLSFWCGPVFNTTYSLPTNVWTMVTMNINAATTNLTFLINGITLTNFSNLIGTSATDSIKIGGYDLDPQQFYGTMDDVRIYNRALSSGEILKLYNGGYGSQK